MGAIALWFEHNPRYEYVALDNFYAQGELYHMLDIEVCDPDDPTLLYNFLVREWGWEFAYMSDDEAKRTFSPTARKVKVELLSEDEYMRRWQEACEALRE